MTLGVRIRRLWGQKVGILVSVLLAALAAVWSLGDISLSPPGIESRSQEMASATTQVLIDTPYSVLLDQRQDASSLDGLTDRALLLGNVVARQPVRQFIARRAGIPFDRLQITPPLTPEQPQAPVDSDTKKSASDIFKSNDEFRLTIEANPTVPLLNIYAQAGDGKTAGLLANAAVDGLRNYLAELARVRATPPEQQVRVVQFGRARGEVLNDGVDVQIAIVVFLLVFIAAAATVVFIGRVREGWRLAVLSERAAAE